MSKMIYNPLEEYESTYKDLHLENTKKFLHRLVEQSGVDIEENRKTVKEYTALTESLSKLKKKFNLWRFLRVLMIITLLLIPLVILKITPKIQAMRAAIAEATEKSNALLDSARSQIAPLNSLFTDTDALRIIEETVPMLAFSPWLSMEQEENMAMNFDFTDTASNEQSTFDILAGHYNGNPFFFESIRTHSMGMETYHGYRTIHWTETYRDGNGRTQVRVRTETLHAMVTKPKPFYHTQMQLNYCAQGGPELSFTRNATHLDRKDEKEIDRYVKRGEKKLKRLTDKALKENKDFVSMSNSDFEVLFDALDRTNEVQFRTLFTPLAQTNMVDLIRSQVGYGDDFDFIKQNRRNTIVSKHRQGQALLLTPEAYLSHSFDALEENFIEKNANYFKALYFDFAPLWAIPIYQDEPEQSLQPLYQRKQNYSCKEYEALSNAAPLSYMAHPDTKTDAILKSAFVNARDGTDEIRISAYSYDIIPQVDFIPVHGRDGRWHNVPVHWDEYVPLETTNRFFVSALGKEGAHSLVAQKNGLCIFS